MRLLKLKQHLREGEWAWPGGYPKYLVMRDGGALCFSCAKKEWHNIVYDHITNNDSGWMVDGVAVNWEDGELACDHCDGRIESAYGEVENGMEVVT